MVTFTVPAPEGETAVTWLSLLIVNEAAGVIPNATALAPVKWPPAITTLVPPLPHPKSATEKRLLAAR